ncbi:MAG: DUF983 domain-containing protein [Bacteroidota bacterium]
MLKGTKLYSILKNTCPQCHKGRFWNAKNPILNIFKKENQLPERCSHCQLKYEKEIGFWYGAMYVSYALGVAIFVAAWIATEVLLPFILEEESLFVQIAIVIVFIVLFAPFNWWYSRLIWINLFVAYKGEKAS